MCLVDLVFLFFLKKWWFCIVGQYCVCHLSRRRSADVVAASLDKVPSKVVKYVVAMVINNDPNAPFKYIKYFKGFFVILKMCIGPRKFSIQHSLFFV